MQKNKITILSTRPVGKAQVEEAAANNIVIDEISFISTEEIIDDALAKKIQKLANENIQAVFTSMNAVEAVRKFIPDQSSWKIFCIGNTTKNLLKNIFGEENITGTADNALDLAENIIRVSSIRKVYFFCGDQRRDELPEKLKDNNIELEELMVYKTIETSKVISKKYDGVLFFSPSAVQSFFSLNAISADTKVFAIGSTTANALKPFTQQHVITADRPGKNNLVEQAIEYFCHEGSKT
ncbi:MAG: uroporphyrinogen-III synthase [Ginsengibacter sp.]